MTNKKDKKRFLDFVFLTDEEYQKLIDKLGKKMTDDYIERLNNYIGSVGRRYKSHYYTILVWTRKELDNRKIKREVEKPNYYYAPEEEEEEYTEMPKDFISKLEKKLNRKILKEF
jgi:hypothetical protein